MKSQTDFPPELKTQTVFHESEFTSLIHLQIKRCEIE